MMQTIPLKALLFLALAAAMTLMGCTESVDPETANEGQEGAVEAGEEEAGEEEAGEETEGETGEDGGGGSRSTAPDIGFYAATGEECCGEDPHPVHGIETPDGGFVLCGKSIDNQGGLEGFLLKIQPPFPTQPVFLGEDEDYTVSWSQTFGSPETNDGANNVAAVGDGVFVAGFEATSNETLEASLRKYDLSTGALVWTAVFPSPSSGTESAFESIQLTEEGGAILGGFTEGEKGGVEGFKSYGNPTSGLAQLTYFSPEQLASSSPPIAPGWEKTYGELGSIRNIRPVPAGGYIFLAAPLDEENPYRVVRTDAEGSSSWETALPNHGEATDVALLTDSGEATGFAVTGHKSMGEGIDGSVTKLSNGGDIVWNITVGNPVGGQGQFAGLGAGNPSLIYDECWGIQGNDAGGAVIACGTGIEGCDEYDPGSDIYNECVSDPRTLWRAMLVEVDGEGTEVWSRTDSFVFPGDNEAAASASEYVIRTASGNYASVIDQDFGIGLMLVEIP